jgi:hypothetical protein
VHIDSIKHLILDMPAKFNVPIGRILDMPIGGILDMPIGRINNLILDMSSK